MRHNRIHILPVLTAVLFLAAAFPAPAQTSIYSFDKKSPDLIKKTYGTPILEDAKAEFTPSYTLQYKNFCVYLDPDDYALVGFETESPDFVMLTGFVSGGIKVGDKISKLNGIEKKDPYFNKAGNGLKTPAIETQLCGKIATHILFEQTTEKYYFYVVNGIIKAMGYYSEYE